MKKLSLTFSFLFLLLSNTYSQEITGKVIHFITQNAISNVAITSDKSFGIASDELGNFTLDISNINSLTFSNLGFETKTLTIDELKENKYIIFLVEKSTELDEIKINASKITLDSLLVKTSQNMKKNMIKGVIKRNFYTLINTKINFKNVELDLKRSTLLNKKNRKLAEKELHNLSNKVLESNPDFSSEFVGILSSKPIFVEKIKKSILMNRTDSLVGFQKIDTSQNFTVNNVDDKMQNLVLKYLNKDESYKVKSGLFTIQDSVSLKSLEKSKDTIDEKKTFNQYDATSITDNAIRQEKMFKENAENNFLNTKYYDHVLEQSEIFKENQHFVVSYSPRKSKAKFSGKIYVNPADYSISKIEYQYAEGKRGNHLNLKFFLGVKFSENIKRGEIHFDKNSNNSYFITYFKEESGIYVYANRSFKFIENSQEKNKIKFNVKFELSTLETSEVLFYETSTNISEDFKNFDSKKLNKRYPYLSKTDYQKSTWKNRKLVLNYLKN